MHCFSLSLLVYVCEYLYYMLRILFRNFFSVSYFFSPENRISNADAFVQIHPKYTHTCINMGEQKIAHTCKPMHEW